MIALVQCCSEKYHTATWKKKSDVYIATSYICAHDAIEIFNNSNTANELSWPIPDMWIISR